MPRVEKKYVKLGVVALAVAALVIGLSVGLTQRNKSNNDAAAAEANNADYVASEPSSPEEQCIPYPYYSKGGKSGGGYGGGPPERRGLVVPGTEEFHAAAGSEEGVRGLATDDYYSVVKEEQAREDFRKGVWHLDGKKPLFPSGDEDPCQEEFDATEACFDANPSVRDCFFKCEQFVFEGTCGDIDSLICSEIARCSGECGAQCDAVITEELDCINRATRGDCAELSCLDEDDDVYYYPKSGKSGSKGAKSGKSGAYCELQYSYDYVCPPDDDDDLYYYGGKSGGSKSGKSGGYGGKSGSKCGKSGSKAGKSGGYYYDDYYPGDDYYSGECDEDALRCHCSPPRYGGKSGGSKSGKSGSYGSKCGKSGSKGGKSGGYHYDDYYPDECDDGEPDEPTCTCFAPSACPPGCVCDQQRWVSDSPGVCIRIPCDDELGAQADVVFKKTYETGEECCLAEFPGQPCDMPDTCKPEPTKSPTVTPTTSLTTFPTVFPTNSPTTSVSPTTSLTTSPTRSPTNSPTTRCDCEEQPYAFNEDTGRCERFPPAAGEECANGLDVGRSLVICCCENFGNFPDCQDCDRFDECDGSIPDIPSDFDIDSIPSPAPTSGGSPGGTTTVSTEVTGPPTKGDRIT